MRHKAPIGFIAFLVCSIVLVGKIYAASTSREVLAFYYGWYGNPQVSGGWRHWKNVDPANERIEGVTNFPADGAYDSHDPAILDRQAKTARAVGITGFIASWWERDS